MGRRPRQHYDGAIYHFIARGNDRQPIFLEPADRRAFERYLCEGIERFGHRCHGYCWMTNHVHMAVEVAEVPLSHIAHNLLFRYARWFHRKYGRSGHLFERRYRAFLVVTDAAFLLLIRYIHLNPVRARLVDEPRSYPWSSYSAYLDPGSGSSSWLTRDLALSLLARARSDARNQLRAYTETDSEECATGSGRLPRPRDDSGSASKSIRGMNDPGALISDPVSSRITIDQILQTVGSACCLEPSELLADVQDRGIVRARSLASYIVRGKSGLTLRELGVALGRDASTLSRSARIVARRLADDSELRVLLEQIEGKLRRS